MRKWKWKNKGGRKPMMKEIKRPKMRVKKKRKRV
jgi:hypothetical protein